MEWILHLYHLPYNPTEPVICFDERPCQLIREVLQPLPMKSGRVLREHYSYKREGTCCALVALEPLRGFRMVEVFEKRSKIEYALFMKAIAEQYPEAKTIHLIQDNLSTHTKGAFYKAFPAKEAFELAQKFQFHFNPVKASWLNMVEIELSAIARLCLNRRIPEIDILTDEVKQLVKERNRDQVKINWQFTVDKARDKFESRYFNSV